MVTILPPGYSLGGQLGQALGQGLQQGMQQAGQVQYQRNLLQNALTKAGAVLRNPETSLTDKYLALMEAGAGIPGSEKYLGPLFEMVSSQQAAEQRDPSQGGAGFGGAGFGGAGIGGAVADQTIKQMQQPAISPTQPQIPKKKPTYEEAIEQYDQAQPSAVDESKFISEIQPKGGLFAPLLSPLQLEAQAQNLAIKFPNRYTFDTALQSLTDQQTNREIAQDKFNKLAEARGIPEADLSIFTKIATKVSDEAGTVDPNSIFLKAKRTYDEYNRKKSAIQSQFIPGFFTKPMKNIPGQGKIAQDLPIQDYIEGRITREGALKRFRPNIKDLVDLGFEQEARNLLAEQGMTPFEVEYVIHPPTKQLENKTKLFKGKTTEDLAKFLYDNITPNDSFLVARDLLKDKFDWKQFQEAKNILNEKIPGYRDSLAEFQRIEDVPLSESPRDSLADIFNSIDRFQDYFKGVRG